MKITLSSMSSLVQKPIATEAVKSAVPSAPGLDVFMSKRALAFTPTAAVQTEETQLARGQRFLEVLREGLRTQVSSPDGASYDVEKTLTNYYPVLSTARALAKDSGLAPGVKTFVDSLSGPRGLHLPDDLSAIAEKAVSGVEGVVVEPKTERKAPSPKLGKARGSTAVPAGASLAEVFSALPKKERTLTVHYEHWEYQLEFQDPEKATYGNAGQLRTHFWNGSFFTPEATSKIKNFGAQLTLKSVLLHDGIKYPNIESIPADDRTLVLFDLAGSSQPIELLDGGKVRQRGAVTEIENLQAEFKKPMQKFDAFVRKSIIDSKPDAPFPSLPERHASEVSVAAVLKPFRDAEPASVQAKVDALAALRGTAPTSPSFTTVLATASSAFEISRITFSALDAAQRKSVLASLTADKHIGSSTILWGLLVDGGQAALTEALIAQGFSPERGARWVARGQQLARLDPAERAFVTAQADFRAFQARLELAQTPRLSQAEIAQRVAAAAEPDRSAVLQNLVDWAAVRGPAQQSEVKAVIDEGLRKASLTGEQVRAALSGGRAAPYLTELTSQLESAVQAVAEADVITRPGAVEALRERIEAGAQLLSLEDAVLQALNSLLERDLKYVLPLKEVDARLGGVAPKAWVEPRSARERLQALQTGSTEASMRSKGSETPTMTFNEAKRLYPALAHSLETLKARLVASHGSALELAYATQRSDALLSTFFASSHDMAQGEPTHAIEAARRAFAQEFEGWATARSVAAAPL